MAKSALSRKHQASSAMKSPVLKLMLLGGGRSDEAGEAALLAIEDGDGMLSDCATDDALLAIEDGMQTDVTSEGVFFCS